LRNYDDIIIKQADKGSVVVILDRDKYVAEAMRQLNDSEVYISLRDDPTVDMIRLMRELKNYIMMGILVNPLFNI